MFSPDPSFSVVNIHFVKEDDRGKTIAEQAENSNVKIVYMIDDRNQLNVAIGFHWLQHEAIADSAFDKNWRKNATEYGGGILVAYDTELIQIGGKSTSLDDRNIPEKIHEIIYAKLATEKELFPDEVSDETSEEN